MAQGNQQRGEGVQRPAGPKAMVERLVHATNAHDVETLVACFAPDYDNETPAHPERGFTGRDQVRKNWTQIFAAIPDLVTEVTALAIDGDTIWTEWEHRGTRPDGTPHILRGVVIFDVTEGLAQRARFYLEPVQDTAGSVDDAIRRQLRPGAAS